MVLVATLAGIFGATVSTAFLIRKQYIISRVFVFYARVWEERLYMVDPPCPLRGIHGWSVSSSWLIIELELMVGSKMVQDDHVGPNGIGERKVGTAGSSSPQIHCVEPSCPDRI